MLEELLEGDESVDSLVHTLRLLSDPTRLKLLGLLERGERNVSALCEALDVPQPTVSHHLALLRLAGLVNNRREGKQVFYGLNDQAIVRHVRPDGSFSISITSGPVELLLQTNGDGTRQLRYHQVAVG